jgi:hypothetical protein
MKKSANRSTLIESVRKWKESDLGSYFYRGADARLSESEISVRAPWLPAEHSDAQIEEGETTNPIRSCWMNEAEVDGQFGDIAEQMDADSVSELVTSIGGDEAVVEAVLSVLEQNDGGVMLLAHEGSDTGYAIAFYEGTYLVAGMEIEEEIVDEGLISIAFLAKYAQDPNAPVTPDFPMIESQNRMFETLMASVTLFNSIKESEAVDAEFVEIIENFNADLANVLGELSIDEGTLSERELEFLVDMFNGVYAGLSEEAANQVNS